MTNKPKLTLIRKHTANILTDMVKPKQMSYLAKDGSEFDSMDDVRASNDSTLFYIVNDYLEGRREILPGTGAVKICIGYKVKVERAPDGTNTKRDVLQYVTKYF